MRGYFKTYGVTMTEITTLTPEYEKFFAVVMCNFLKTEGGIFSTDDRNNYIDRIIEQILLIKVASD
jgi:hypothetical protein